MRLFVNNLTNVDFSYLHRERGLVGETWFASIELDGKLDEQGMICDFGIVKKTVRKWLDQTIDHVLIAPRQSPNLRYEHTESNVSLTWRTNSHEKYVIECRSPSEAITFIDSDYISPDSVASWCIDQLRILLPNSIDKIQLFFEPESITNHYYHYSHGLKKHDGNCQRIAHGHRSTIEIEIDGKRNKDLENRWCQKWQDIYIGSREDLTEVDTVNEIKYYTFQYTAKQGQFSLRLPVKCCDLIETESTVELIAQHIAQQLKAERPDSNVRVRAYEGIGKGAIARS